MKLVKKALADQLVPAMLIVASVVVPAVKLEQSSTIYFYTCIFGVVLSIFFSASSQHRALYLPGILQTTFLCRTADHTSEIVFVAGVFGLVLYATRATYFLQKLTCKSSAAVTSFLALVLFADLVTQSFDPKSVSNGKGLVVAAAVGCLLVVATRIFSAATRNWCIFGGFVITLLAHLFGVYPRSTGHPTPTFSVLTLLEFSSTTAVFSNKVIIRGVFLSLIGHIETATATLRLAQRGGNDQSDLSRLQLAATNFAGSLFGFLPVSVPIFGSTFLPQKQLKNHLLVLLCVGKMLFSAHLFGISKNTSVLIGIFGLFLALTFLTALLNTLPSKGSLFRTCPFILVGVGVFWVVLAITHHALIAAFTTLLLQVTLLLFRTTRPTGYTKHYDFAGFEASELGTDDTIVYKMDGNLTFLFLEKHKAKILGLSERNVLVDARGLVAGFDADFIESYREFVQDLTAAPEKRVEFFGLEGLTVPISTKNKKIKSI